MERTGTLNRMRKARLNFAIELFNSILYAIGSIALTLAVSIPAGYAASRLTFSAKRAVMLLILATSMIPGVALLIPGVVVIAIALAVVAGRRVARLPTAQILRAE